MFLFGAGEEISWGQRLFGFGTPDFLASINVQNETNIHNIEGMNFYQLFTAGISILCIVTGAAYFARKSDLFGIPLPSPAVMFVFLLVFSIREPGATAHYLQVIFHPSWNWMLLTFFVYAWFSRHIRLLFLSILFIAIVVFNRFVLHEFSWQLGSNAASETREYLFSVASLLYAGELYCHRKKDCPAGRVSKALARSVAACLVVLVVWSIAEISASLAGRMSLVQAANRVVEGSRAGALEPTRRSRFDVYYREDMLVYNKTDCARSDTDAPFFLHIVPADPDDLPDRRKQYGFDNLDFRWRTANIGRPKGQCTAAVRLPDYPAARIRTGQWVPAANRQLWKVEFDARAPDGTR